MFIKKKFIRLFITLILPILTYTTKLHTKAQRHSHDDRSKRFTLQDLFGGGQQASSLQQAQDTQSSDDKTQTVDIQSLLAAVQNRNQQQQQQQQNIARYNKPVDIDLNSDKSGNINLADLPALLKGARGGGDSQDTSSNSINFNDMQTLQTAAKQLDGTNVVKEEFNLGKEKLEIEAAGKRATHYTLVKGPDGGLNLVPVVNGAAQTNGNKFEVLQPKGGSEEKGRSRQQMQLTTLSQALYSPFPSDQNTLHLHLKGKDGKDGKPGAKGPMGSQGPKGPVGPAGPKGDAGTCSAQINGLFECTPEMLDTLSNRIDYLEKICQKVEIASKKHSQHPSPVAKNKTKLVMESPESKALQPQPQQQNKDNEPTNQKEKATREQQKQDDTEMRKQKVADISAEKKFKLNSLLNGSTQQQKQTITIDPSTLQSIKSILDVRNKLKVATLDLMDRVRQAEEGVMKTLKHR